MLIRRPGCVPLCAVRSSVKRAVTVYRMARSPVDSRAGEETKMADCIFCSIANHDIPTDPIYEDELIIAFNDLEPQAPVHFLVVPKKHIESLNAATDEDAELISHIMLTIPKLAAEQGLDAGYRVVINTGDEGGQTVKHLHFHILGKRKMTWPPG